MSIQWEKFNNINNTYKRVIAILVNWHISTRILTRLVSYPPVDIFLLYSWTHLHASFSLWEFNLTTCVHAISYYMNFTIDFSHACCWNKFAFIFDLESMILDSLIGSPRQSNNLEKCIHILYIFFLVDHERALARELYLHGYHRILYSGVLSFRNKRTPSVTCIPRFSWELKLLKNYYISHCVIILIYLFTSCIQPMRIDVINKYIFLT